MPDLIDNHKKNLLDVNDCDVYFNFWDHYGLSLRTACFNCTPENEKILRCGVVKEDLITDEHKNFLLENYKPVKVEYENYNNLLYRFEKLTSRMQEKHARPYYRNVVSMFYKIWKCNEMIQGKYDVILRIRPDMVFRNPMKFLYPEQNTIYTDHNEARSLPNCNGCNDIFAYGNKQSIDAYSRLYLNWSEYEKMHHLLCTENAVLHKNRYGDDLSFFNLGSRWSGEIILKIHLLYEKINIVNDINWFLNYNVHSELYTLKDVENTNKYINNIKTNLAI